MVRRLAKRVVDVRVDEAVDALVDVEDRGAVGGHFVGIDELRVGVAHLGWGEACGEGRGETRVASGRPSTDRRYNLEECANQRTPKCRCFPGYTGKACEVSMDRDRGLHKCMNDCSGRGKCEHNWCRCDDGWWGIDCSFGAAPSTAAAWLEMIAACIMILFRTT